MGMFKGETYSSRIDEQGRLILASTSKSSIVEYCPSMGATMYGRRTA